MRLGIADKIFIEFEVDPSTASSVLPTASTDVPHLISGGSPSELIDFPMSRSSLDGPSSDGSLLQCVGLEVEEPWNMGRRGGVDASAQAAAQAAAAVSRSLPPSAPEAPSALDQARGSRSGRLRAPRQRKTICTYAFLWPVLDPSSLGEAGLAESMASLPRGLSYDPPPGSPFSGLPSWLYGLHSVRYNPGPDWIEPSEQETFQARPYFMSLS